MTLVKTNKILFIAFAFLSICFISCSQLTNKKENNTLKKNPNTLSTIILRDSLMPIINSLVKFNCVEDSLIGAKPTPSGAYYQFRKLLEIASDSELIKLTDYKNASVRAYAFWGLAKRHNPQVKTIMHNHIMDDDKFSYTAGCIEMKNSVNNFYLGVLTPNNIDVDCIKLSEAEIKNLQTLIPKK